MKDFDALCTGVVLGVLIPIGAGIAFGILLSLVLLPILNYF